MVEESVLSKARRVKMLILDVDGVLTDGRIVYDSRGRDSKFFDVHDGLGVYLLRQAGIPTILITAKSSRAISPRARDMRVEAVIEARLPANSKKSVLKKITARYNIGAEEVCFVGDDLVDLGIMKDVGFPVAVFNACPEIKRSAVYITLRHGGKGAVREVAELILKSQGVWQRLISRYEE